MKDTNFNTVWQIIELLQKSVRGYFQNNSLEENQVLLKKLEDFQLIIFDRQQDCNPNSCGQSIKEELFEISINLRTVIAYQLPEKTFTEGASLKEIFDYFDFAFNLDNGPYFNLGLRRGNIGSGLQKKAQNYFAEIIIKRCEGKKKFYPFLEKVQDHYNGSEPIYQKVEKVLKSRKKERELST
jgi:hypothetical protein